MTEIEIANAFMAGYKEGQKRKKGVWIAHRLPTDIQWGYDCSACNEWFVIGSESIKKYNFCPNCGADMRPREEN